MPTRLPKRLVVRAGLSGAERFKRTSQGSKCERTALRHAFLRSASEGANLSLPTKEPAMKYALGTRIAAALVLGATPGAAFAQEWDPGPMSMGAGSVANEYDSIQRSRRVGVPVLRGKEAERYFAARRERAARLRNARAAGDRTTALRRPAKRRSR